jgi:hypothetical protein
MLAQYAGQQDVIGQRHWYAGTATVLEGTPLYYDLDDTNAPVVDSWDPSVDPGSSSLTTTGNENLRGFRVYDVNANGSTGSGGLNTCQLAGVVAPDSSGITGPNFVTLISAVKSRVANIQINYNNAAKGDIVQPDESTPSNTFGLFHTVAGYTSTTTVQGIAQMAAIVMQTGPTSGTTASAPAKVLAKFL